MRRLFLLLVSGCLLSSLACFSHAAESDKTAKTLALFDKELSQFEVWLGIPHPSIEGISADDYSSEQAAKKKPIGLVANNQGLKNFKDTFSMVEQDGELVLKVDGQIYAGLTTKASFSDYYLSVYFKWGDKKWEPRLAAKRDSGILYHCYGGHGSFHKVWKRCLEYQVQETDLGDFIGLAGPQAFIRGISKFNEGWNRNMFFYEPSSSKYLLTGKYTSANQELDKPHGEWNHLEIYILGNDAVHLVNGVIVLVLEDAIKHDGSPLTQGQIQLQSEAAECYYKQLTVTPISEFPEFIQQAVEFKQSP